jgi:hypothetical protein
MPANDFVDPYPKRRACEEDYVSPAWADEEVVYSSIASSSDGSLNTIL